MLQHQNEDSTMVKNPSFISVVIAVTPVDQFCGKRRKC